MCGDPKISDWKINVDGPRTIEEAILLLAENGINLPTDVKLVRYDDLPPNDLAAYLLPHLTLQNTRWAWCNLLNDFGEVTIKVSLSTLKSDEKIIAGISHELYELECLRKHFEENESISSRELYFLISTTNPSRNFHCMAWRHADRAVLEFRRRKP
jgi:hypothetical protein